MTPPSFPCSPSQFEGCREQSAVMRSIFFVEVSLLSLLSTTTALNTRRALLEHGAAIAAASSFGSCLSAPAALAFAGEGTMSKEEVLRIAEEKLTPFQRAISLSAATERSFTGMTTNGYAHDNKKKGTWAGAISGAPLFDSSTKYESGTGWPSFYAAVPGAVVERPDPEDLADRRRAMAMGGVRTEVIDAKSGAHLGHVFPDGPPPTYKRYCMNAGAMTFVPAR